MRINKLEFAAVGPFADHHVIDFDALGQSALYLIDGPTGAGKSTIIDCIVYALYDEMSGEASDDARMRSHFASSETPTFVELTFTSSHGTFRVRRNPEYSRRKKIGEGETSEPASATLWRLEKSGQVTTLAKKIGDVNTELSKKIIGLTKSQFTQTVVLPQGEFATFLRAETKDREPLLSKIFATGVYEKVAAVLKEQAKAVARSKAEVTTELLQTLAQFQLSVQYTAEQREAMAEKINKDIDDDVLTEVASAVDGVEAELLTAESHMNRLLEAKSAAESALRERRIELDAQLSVTRNETAVAEQQAALNQALQALASHAEVINSAGVVTDSAFTVEQWRQASTTIAALTGQLTDAQEIEARLAKHPERRAALTEHIVGFEKDLEQIVVRIGQLPALIQEHKNAADVSTARGRVEAIELELTALRAELSDHQRLSTLKTELAAAEKEQAAAQDTALAQQKHRDELVTRRIAGMAGELASQLRAGDACQVCGSTSHPKLASLGAEAVSAGDVSAADAAVVAALETLSVASAAATKLVTSVKELELRITSNRETLESHIEALSDEKKTLASQINLAATAEAQVEVLESELTQANEKQLSLARSIATHEEKLNSEDAQAAQDGVAVESARGNYSSVTARLKALTIANDCLHDCEQARAELDASAAALQVSRENFEKLIQHDQFAAVDAAVEVLNEADTNYQEAQLAHVLVDERWKKAVKQADAIRQGILARQEIASGSRDLVRLADVFNKDLTGQSINIYVLQALFADVLNSANARLADLLEGRYRLVVSDESDGHKSSKRGLGLNVMDTRTGEERSAKTLSGGESFCASLALALGMADVVRANAGGITIETLFIDEGFGSLDGTRLTDVMNMLQGLKLSGRSVGVISHVDEMKGQIQERINVIPGGRNPTTKLEVSWMA